MAKIVITTQKAYTEQRERMCGQFPYSMDESLGGGRWRIGEKGLKK